MAITIGQSDKGKGTQTATTAGVTTGATGSTFWIGVNSKIQPFTSTGSSITTGVLTVGTLASGSMGTGALLSGTGVTGGAYLGSNITGGSASGSTWNVVGQSGNVGAEAINGAVPIPAISGTIGGVADGNTYTQIGSAVNDGAGGGSTIYRFYCQNGAGGATHKITAAFAVATPTLSVLMQEFPGAVLTGGPDQSNSAFNNFASSLNTGSITITPPAGGEGLIVFMSSDGYPTAAPAISGGTGTSWTPVIEEEYTDATASPPCAIGVAIVTASGTYNSACSDSGGSTGLTCSIDSFQAPAGPVLYGDGTSASNTVVTTGTGGQAMPAITSGQVLDIVLMAETGSALTDSGPVWVGTSGGSFTNIQTISSTGYIFDHWQCVVTTSVALPVIKTTWSGGTPTKAGIAVVPNNGVLISNPISAGNYNVNHQITPTGTDGQVSGNTTNPLTTGLLYLMGSYGFSFGQASAPTAGTGFASIATMWASLGSGACLNYETRTLTGAGAVAQATFTPVGGSDSMTVMAVFNSSFVPLMGQACL